jgi:hypothetical protein
MRIEAQNLMGFSFVIRYFRERSFYIDDYLEVSVFSPNHFFIERTAQ